MFKQTCTNFLNNITALRSAAIDKAVNDAVNRDHVPYEKELIEVRDVVVLEKRNKTAEKIKALQADLEREVNQIYLETSNAINEHKNRVVAAATANAKAEYDTFILDVSKLVDKTNID